MLGYQDDPFTRAEELNFAISDLDTAVRDYLEITDAIDELVADERYRDNPEAFIDAECMTFNPDHDPALMPFHLYDYQRQTLDDIYQSYREESSLLIEKSRQMGISWLMMAFFLWALIYDPDFSGIALSYKENLVDDGGSESTLKSLFGRLRFMYVNLRPALQGNLSFKHLHVWNRRTHAYLIGENAHPNAGRGGSYKIGLWDETAAGAKTEETFMAFYQATRCRIYNSTPRGMGNLFARLRFSPEATVRIMSLHWRQHPERGEGAVRMKDGRWSSPWYEQQCRDMTPQQIAQELDIDYETSVEGRVYDKFRTAFHVLDEPIEFVENRPTVIAWDLGVADQTFGVVMQKDAEGVIGVIDEIVSQDEEIRFYIDILCGVAPPELQWIHGDRLAAFRRFLQNARQRNYSRYVQVAGPDSGNRTITSKRSVRQQFLQAGQLGVKNGKQDRRYRNMQMISLTGYRIMDRIVAVRKVMDPTHCRFYVSKTCPMTAEALSNYAWQQTSEGFNRETPSHDQFSHGADAVGYGVLYFERHKKPMMKPRTGESVVSRPMNAHTVMGRGMKIGLHGGNGHR